MRTMMDIGKILADAGYPVSNFQFLESQYSLPTARWVLDVFPSVFRSNLRKKGLSKWVRNQNDCNLFAMGAYMLAREAHANSGERDTGLSVGLIVYSPDNADNDHVINFWIAIDDDTREPRIITTEPQKDVFVELNLSKTEIENISWGLI